MGITDVFTLMNTQDLRLMRRMIELMPIIDPLKKEKSQLDKVEFSKLVTFLTTRPIQKEVAFYYLLHNNVIDYVKLFTAETIKDIYFQNHPEYKSFYDVQSPIVVIMLGMELYNNQMITILNLFADSFLRNINTKALIYIYQGSSSEFKDKYKRAQERGVLNTGKVITLSTVSAKTKDSFEF